MNAINKTTPKIKRNFRWVFDIFVALCVIALFCAWLFLHPNSPWHTRYIYLVAFKEIGDLKVGDAVNVGGLTKGRVVSFELADNCVWTVISVLAEVKIPVDSKLRVANAGLMGERVVEISLGNSKIYYDNGMYLKGNFDIGSTSIGELTVDIIKEASSIVSILTEVTDTLFNSEKIKTYKRIGQKAENLGNTANNIVSNANTSLLISIDSLILAKNKVASIIDSIKPNINNVQENIQLLSENFVSLEKSLESIKKAATNILNENNSTVVLSLNKNLNGALLQEISEIIKDAEILMNKIKKNGLDLNVDIF